MASMPVTNSIGSTQLQDLESLREQLLHNSPFSANPSRQHFSHRTDRASQQYIRASQIQDSQVLQHEKRTEATSANPPQLNVVKSAPELLMAAMVDESPSQHMRVPASSFHAFPGGDTQPMESQVYRDYRPAANEPAQILNTPARPLLAVESTTAKSLFDESSTGFWLRNASKEANSYIDLAKVWPENMSQTAKSTTSDMEDFLVSPEAHFGQTSRPLVMPQTPQVGMEQQGDAGDLFTVERSSKTPGIEFAFGPSKTPMISATQAFNQTQAVSSPLPDGIRSDPILTRPSPNMHDENSMVPSNLGFSSSPAITRQRPASAAGEPRDWYTSMRESQERRERVRVSENMPTIEEASDESLGTMLKRHDRQKLRRTLSEQLVAQRHGRAQRSPLQVDGHIRKRRRISKEPIDSPQHDEVQISDVEDEDGPVIDDHVSEQDGLPDHLSDSSQAEPGDDAYDEFGQTLLRSQAHHDTEEEVGQDENEAVPVVPHAHLAPDMDSYMVSISSQHISYEPGKVFHSTQPSATMNSQVGAQSGDKRSLLSQLPDQQSSMTNIVPGSQYAVPTSQSLSRQQRISASQAHELSSSGHDAYEKVPSSPPLEAADETRASDVQPDLPSNETSGHAFTTARSHISSQAADPVARSVTMPQTQDSMITPLKMAGALRFADIAGSQSALPREDSIDLDAIMNDVITNDDEQYLQAMQSPSRLQPRKRRKLTRTIVSSDPASSAPVVQQTDNIDADVDRTPDMRSKQMGPATVTLAERTSISSPSVIPNDAVEESEQLAEVHRSSDADPSPQQKGPSLLRTPQSVLVRERAGKNAVSRLVQARSKQRADPVDRQAHARQTYSRKRRRQQEQPNEENSDTFEHQSQTTSAPSAITNAPAQADEHSMADPRPASDTDAVSFVAPHRVFALFGGGFNAYYPASVVARSGDNQMLSVRFDDTSEVNVKASEVFPLDLQVQDVVRVDIPSMRKSTWMIKGLSNGHGQSQSFGSDIRGHTLLEVQAKSAQNRSTSTHIQSEGEIHKVALSSVYLTHNLAPSYRGRSFAHQFLTLVDQNRPSTPALPAVHPAITPTSRSGRQRKSIARALAVGSPSASERSVSLVAAKSQDGIFSNMAFAISLSGPDSEKRDLARKIEDNGGIVLDKGFDELFELPSTNDNHEQRTDNLTLKPAFRQYGFVALIATICTRRAKYMQALALGLPTLSSRWVQDSLNKDRNTSLASDKAAALTWSRYLLPAGESQYLDGAIRSRNLTPAPPEKAKLSDTVATRAQLLNGDKVLLVAPQKGRSNQITDRVRLYTFLTMAMGAGIVQRVASLAEAGSMVKSDDSWKWIHVDSDVDSCARFLFGNPKSRKTPKKTKKGANTAQKVKSGSLFVKSLDGKATVVSDEYVIQSLILGALLD